MTTENDFLPFAAASGANVLTQAQYAALSALAGGFVSGVASSAAANKVLRQASIMAAVLADFIVAESGQPAIDDGTTATLQTNLVAAIVAVVISQFASPAFSGIPTAPTAAPGTNTDQLATTAFVEVAIGGGYATESWVNAAIASALTGYLPKNNPTFTGTMTGPAYNKVP